MDIDTKQVEIEVLKNWVQNLDSKLSSALTDIDTLTQKLNKTEQYGCI